MSPFTSTHSPAAAGRQTRSTGVSPHLGARPPTRCGTPLSDTAGSQRGQSGRAAQGQISRCHTHSGSGASQCAVGSGCPAPGGTGGRVVGLPPTSTPLSPLTWTSEPRHPCPAPAPAPARRPRTPCASPATPARGRRRLSDQLPRQPRPLTPPPAPTAPRPAPSPGPNANTGAPQPMVGRGGPALPRCSQWARGGGGAPRPQPRSPPAGAAGAFFSARRPRGGAATCRAGPASARPPPRPAVCYGPSGHPAGAGAGELGSTEVAAPSGSRAARAHSGALARGRDTGGRKRLGVRVRGGHHAGAGPRRRAPPLRRPVWALKRYKSRKWTVSDLALSAPGCSPRGQLREPWPLSPHLYTPLPSFTN